MDSEWYLIEYLIRDRLTDARARARTAALLRQANDSPRSKRDARLAALGGVLGRNARKVGAAIAHALRGRARIAKGSPLSLSTRRGA